jgi:hypothetical protein
MVKETPTPPPSSLPPAKKQKLTEEVIDLTNSPPPATAKQPTDQILTFGVILSSMIIYPESIELVTSGKPLFGEVERCHHITPGTATTPPTRINYIRIVVMREGKKVLMGQLDNTATVSIYTCPERGIDVKCMLKPGMGITVFNVCLIRRMMGGWGLHF